jgi:hypothetical protein
MATKAIRIAPSGTTDWVTLPGNTGELTRERDSLDDTVFGKSFMSKQPDIGKWNINAQAFYKGFSGYKAVIKKTSGSATAMTDEATTLVTTDVYRITNSAHRLMDPATAVVVEDGGVAVDTDDIDYIDYLDGTVKFKDAYTAGGAITITGAYLTATQICTMNQFTLTQTADAVDKTNMCNVQSNGGFREYEVGLKTVSLDLSGFFDATPDFHSALVAASSVLIEIAPTGALTTSSFFRGIFKPTSDSQNGKVGALEEEFVKYELYVPDIDLMLAPAKWYHVSSTLNTAVRSLLDAWQDGELVEVQYLYDGTNGWAGEGVPTDVSLKGGIGNLNEFSANIQGSGALADVP